MSHQKILIFLSAAILISQAHSHQKHVKSPPQKKHHLSHSNKTQKTSISCQRACLKCNNFSCCKKCKKCTDPAPCTFKELCIRVPARVENTQFFGKQNVPAANIFVRIIGDLSNPIVFFCHDTNFSCDMWLCQQNFLCSQGYCTIAVDLRGHGRSNKTPANPIPLVPPAIPIPTPGHINYVYETFANDIQSVLSQLGVNKPFTWVGVSDGSSMGIKYFSLFNGTSKPNISRLFVLNPWRILRVPNCAILPLCLPNLCIDPVTHEGICFPQAPFPETLGIVLDTLARMGNDHLAGGLVAALSLFPELCKLQLLPLQQYTISAIGVNVTDIILSFFNTEFRQDLQSILPKINIPVAVGFGNMQQLPFSPIQTPPSAMYVAQQIPGAKLIQFTGKGFFPQMTASTDVNNTLLAFLKGKITQKFTVVPDTGCQICPLIGAVNFSNQCPQA